MRRMPVRMYLLSLVSLLSFSVAAANAEENVLDRFTAHTFVTATDYKLPYRQLAPAKIEEGKKYPLVLFLHGAGERGNDNAIQLVHGMKDFASDAIMKEYPAYVIAPQCPNNEQWVDVPWSSDAHELPAKPSKSMAATIELIESLKKELPIDSDRVYVTGLSMGGFGTWDIICRHPDWFAAALPICGGGDAREETVKLIKNIPIWAVHGDKDSAVKPQRSRDMIAALKKVGSEPKYTERENTGHDSWSATYKDPETYRWLFAQKRASK